MPTPRHQLSVGVARNAAGRTILYAIGGSTPTGRVEAYDPIENTWRQRASFPLGGLERMNGIATLHGRLYISGADVLQGASRRFFSYNPATNTWTERRSLPIPSWGGITTRIGGKIYVLTGGCPSCFDDPAGTSRRLYSYDPTTNVWTRLADCPNYHILGVGGEIGGKFYVAGGDDVITSSFSVNLDVYDPATNTWSSRAPMPTRRLQAAGAVLGKKLYVMGGLDVSDVFNTVEAYDPVTNRWTTKAPMPTARFGLAAGTIQNAAGVYQILAVGGGDNGTVGLLSTSEAYTR